jgi:hypothetical protein
MCQAVSGDPIQRIAIVLQTATPLAWIAHKSLQIGSNAGSGCRILRLTPKHSASILARNKRLDLYPCEIRGLVIARSTTAQGPHPGKYQPAQKSSILMRKRRELAIHSHFPLHAFQAMREEIDADPNRSHGSQ